MRFARYVTNLDYASARLLFQRPGCWVRNKPNEKQEVDQMQFPIWVKPAMLGGAIGIIGALSVGFANDWIVTAGAASKMAQHEADQAVLASLTPICVAQFSGEGTPKLLASLEQQSTWQRGDFIEEHGWATMPGSDKPNEDVANACAHELMKQIKG